MLKRPWATATLWWLLHVAVMPSAALVVSRLTVNPNARLVAPLLFVSPAIAWGAGFMVLSRVKWFKAFMRQMYPDPVSPTSEMDEYAAKYSRLEPVGKVRFAASPRKPEKPSEIAWASKSCVMVALEAWEHLDPQAREFAVARGYAAAATAPKTEWWTWFVLPLLVFSGCFLATINLWFVIAGQSVIAIGMALSTNLRHQEVNLADLKALEWSRDLAAALRYVEASTRVENASMPQGRDQRMRDLREHAAKLGIGAA